jgi:hypothetical protein
MGSARRSALALIVLSKAMHFSSHDGEDRNDSDQAHHATPFDEQFLLHFLSIASDEFALEEELCAVHHCEDGSDRSLVARDATMKHCFSSRTILQFRGVQKQPIDMMAFALSQVTFLSFSVNQVRH